MSAARVFLWHRCVTTGLTSQPWKNTEDFSHFGKIINRFINTFMYRVLFSFFLFKLQEWISGLYDKTCAYWQYTDVDRLFRMWRHLLWKPNEPSSILHTRVESDVVVHISTIPARLTARWEKQEWPCSNKLRRTESQKLSPTLHGAITHTCSHLIYK